MDSGQAGENQIEENEWKRIECACRENDAVDGDPDEEHCPKTNKKFPTAAKLCDVVGEALAESEFPFELFAEVAGKNLVLFQAFDHFLVQRGKFANLVF